MTKQTSPGKTKEKKASPLGKLLFEPHPSIMEVGEKRQARLISIIAFAVTITNSLGILIIASTVKDPGSVVALGALAAVTAISYIISRTRFQWLSSSLIVWALTLGAFFNISGGEFTSNSLNAYLIVALVIASIGFKFKLLLVYSIFINIVIPLLPFFYPEYNNVGADLAVYFPYAIFTLLAVQFRSNVEKDRLAELQTANRELEDVKDNLELRVNERTRELEKIASALQSRTDDLESVNVQIQRRASQFEALAQVAQSIASIRDLQELLPRVATVVSENYGFYHVGLFLIDEANEYAMLIASNSEGGKKMIERQHRLKVGEQGIVGSVTGSGNPRIALDVGEDAVFFTNPELPNTHSEMALPLRSGGKIIGALDVQSTETGAFTNEDVQTLSLLADQVSLAIENARLFEDSNRTLTELQMVMRQSTRETWKRLPEQQKLFGYRYNAMGASPLREPIDLAETGKGRVKVKDAEAGSFVVPIELRGEVIGSLVVQSPTGKKWDEDQQDLIKAVAERVALSAENARLFDETTQRAERERLVSDITGKIRSHNDPKAMIETAINELRNVLGASKVEVIPQSSGGKDSKV